MLDYMVATDTALGELVERSRSHDEHKHDHASAASGLHFEALAPNHPTTGAPDERYRDTYLTTPPELWGSTPPLKLTDLAYRQMFSKLGPVVFGKGSPKSVPFDYMQAISPELRAYVLNRHLAEANGRQWLVRGYDDVCRAVVDKDYPDLKNTEMLEALDMAIEQERDRFPELKLVRPYVSADELHVKVIWRNILPPGGDGPYGIGVYMGNSELGNRTFRLFPMIQRHSCTNSIMLEQDGGLVVYHRGSLEAKKTQIYAAIGELFGVGAELVNRMILADAHKIPAFEDVLNGLAKQFGWSQEVKTAVAVGTEGHDTRFGLVNGVSYAAHKIVGAKSEAASDMADMEMLAGRLLVAPDSLFGRAAHLGKYAREEVAA